MTLPVNIGDWVPRIAVENPYAPAIYSPCGRRPDGRTLYVHLTFRQLHEEVEKVAAALTARGMGRGVRTVLMVRPSLELFVLTFALFRAGAIPVLVDPGIGLKNLGTCLGEAEPEAFVGIPKAQAARVLLRWSPRTIRKLVTVGRRWFWGGCTLQDLRTEGESLLPWTPPVVVPDDMAAVLFTSGSTGVPKGVVYSHANFVAQVEMIRELFQATPGEVDLPTFPLFALFNPALGLCTVIPDMDPTRPARVDPRRIQQAIEDFGVAQMFGSPALLDTVGRFAVSHGVSFPTLRRVFSAGAPVSATILHRFAGLLSSGAQVHTPYGATEALPLATIGSDELAATRALTDAGGGVCVGRPLFPNQVHVIPIDDGPVTAWRDDLPLPPGEVGEIVVRGPTASAAYFHRESATRLAKIACEGGFFHRMGDLGRFDDQGRLWFCGRKTQRVVTPSGTLFTIPCEAVFNTHPAVHRSALVGLSRGGVTRPVICLELEQGVPVPDLRTLRAELLEIGARHEHTRSIRDLLVHPAFPVDIRHNAKIGREKLSIWAARRLP